VGHYSVVNRHDGVIVSQPMPEARISDEMLMRRFQEAFDEQAMDELVARYGRAAQTIAGNIVGHSAAEDAVQETFIRIVGARKSYDHNRSFSSWFYSILRNVCIDILRKERRRAKQLEELAEQAREDRQAPKADGRVEAALRILPAMDRDVLILRLVHGMPFQEIADQLECSLDAAKKRAQRALRRLREDRSLLGAGETGDWALRVERPPSSDESGLLGASCALET
jgi:RNA polymerase sigma factor (sigma-70 family)